MPIKEAGLCQRCLYMAGGPLCNNSKCKNCDHFIAETVTTEKNCLCLTIHIGDPCPYFKPLHPTKPTEETDYEEILRTFF